MEKEITAIIQRAQQGDEEAFAQLYQIYYHAVFYKAFQMTRNEADAKDLAQEVFCVMCRSLSQLRDPQHFYAWLMMITSNRTKNYFRKHKHDAVFLESMQDIDIQEYRIDANPQFALHDQNDQELLLSMIRSLPHKYAEVLELAYIKELKLQEVANLLHIPLGTVKTRIVRGRNVLKKNILLFEQQEQRKLSFHVDQLLPLTILGSGWISSICGSITNKIKQATTAITSNAGISGCVLSLSVLATSAGVFVYNDLQQAQASAVPSQRSAIQEHEPSAIAPSPNELPSLPQYAFPTTMYKGHSVSSSRDAYYICMNFAMDEEDLQAYSQAELDEIIPVYEILKKENSTHYQMLQKKGWTDLFESYAYPTSHLQ